MKYFVMKASVVLILAMLALVIVWRIERSAAQDKPDKTAQPTRPEGRNRPPAPRPPMGQQLGAPEALSNAKIQQENQRHREVMQELNEQARTLQEKIRDARKAKMEEIKNQKKAEPEPTKPGNPETPQTNPGAVNPEEMMKGEMEKINETYRPDADKIAASIIAELILNQKNLADILNSEQAEIKNKITEHILMPSARPNRPPVPGQVPPKKEPDEKSGIPKPDAPK